MVYSGWYMRTQYEYSYYSDVMMCDDDRKRFLLQINQMGLEGWELVNMVGNFGSNQVVVAWFKRII
jgi:hypothetical protein